MNMENVILLALLTRWASEYAPHARASIVKSRHMNRLGETVTVTQDEVDAILADFINHVARHQGVDYGLCAWGLR